MVFCSTLIVLGAVQSTMSTLRFFNASEEAHEHLAPKKIYSVGTETGVRRNLSQILSEKVWQENVGYYVLENRDNIEAALESMPPEKAEKARAELNAISETYKIEPFSGAQKKSPTSLDVDTPVKVTLAPEWTVPPTGYKDTIYTVVTGSYFRDALWDFPVIIDTSRTSPRGQMKNESITLSTSMKSLPEVAKVLVHEIGHMIDIYTLKSGISGKDISEDFYAISWSEPTVMKKGLGKTDFVSGYAATNQYEDFAESFAMYVFHNAEFEKRSKNNDILRKKYAFLRTHIFGEAFSRSAFEKTALPETLWDVTKITLKTENLSEVFAWIEENILHA